MPRNHNCITLLYSTLGRLTEHLCFLCTEQLTFDELGKINGQEALEMQLEHLCPLEPPSVVPCVPSRSHSAAIDTTSDQRALTTEQQAIRISSWMKVTPDLRASSAPAPKPTINTSHVYYLTVQSKQWHPMTHNTLYCAVSGLCTTLQVALRDTKLTKNQDRQE